MKEKEGYLFFPQPDYAPVFCRVKNGLFSIYRKNQRAEHIELLLCSVREFREQNLLHGFQLINPQSRFTFQAAV